MGPRAPSPRRAGQLKLASGTSAPHRLKDPDVLELVKALALPRDTADVLDPSVREKFDERWQAAQSRDARVS